MRWVIALLAILLAAGSPFSAPRFPISELETSVFDREAVATIARPESELRARPPSLKVPLLPASAKSVPASSASAPEHTFRCAGPGRSQESAFVSEHRWDCRPRGPPPIAG